MCTVILHRGIRIVTLSGDETVSEHCSDGDIVLVQDKHGWWTRFVGPDGHTDSYDTAFDSYDKALWTAKAAAEFSAE
ncbi:MAG TPA: hypothetical protein VEC01_11225 [Noviherbaspirillum sp.]|uniref:hypothetical protein n=1 Tax=Noviherbaspirillum sp. TaxID=1926288 RepID=UPI002D626272|nr:hypothetical protein [Noviherbaspirillum sp.]HYD95888.1 hypothetical protein [Noviherbaspirillum sp.]